MATHHLAILDRLFRYNKGNTHGYMTMFKKLLRIQKYSLQYTGIKLYSKKVKKTIMNNNIGSGEHGAIYNIFLDFLYCI